MLRIEIDGFKPRFTTPVPMKIESALDKMCKFMPTGIEYTDKFKDTDWDGFIHLYKNRQFPIGLLDRIRMFLLLKGVKLQVIDHREYVGRYKPMATSTKLRDYQSSIEDECYRKNMGLVQAATGAGKTIIFAHLIARLGLPTIIIVPTIDLVYQTSDKLEMVTGVSPVVIPSEIPRQGGENHTVSNGSENPVSVDPLEKTVNTVGKNGGSGDDLFMAISTWQGIHSKINKYKGRKFTYERSLLRKYLGQFDVIIADEAHYAGARCVYRVLSRIPAMRRYGFSATPWRTDNADIKMNAVMGDVIGGISATELIDMGYLMRPTIKFLHPPLPSYHLSGSWKEVYSDYIVHNEERNWFISEKAIELADEGRTVLVMVSQINHGDYLKKMIPDSVFINGTVSKKKRKKISKDLRDGKIPITICSDVFNIGVDFPILDGGILAGPYKSSLINLQRIGRFLRLHPDKKEPLIYDTMDSVRYMRDWSMERKYTYEMESGYNVT